MRRRSHPASNFILMSLSFSLLGVGFLVWSQRIEESSKIKCDSFATAIVTPTIPPIPLPKPEKIPEVQVVRSCQGYLSRVTADENGEEVILRAPRSIFFISSPDGVPNIITARISNVQIHDVQIQLVSSLSMFDANDSTLREHGILAEHGSISGLRAQDLELRQSRFQSLISEAAELCLGPIDDAAQLDIELAKFTEEINERASHYLSLDLDLQNPEAKISLYFELNGKFYRSDLPVDLRPI